MEIVAVSGVGRLNFFAGFKVLQAELNAPFDDLTVVVGPVQVERK